MTTLLKVKNFCLDQLKDCLINNKCQGKSIMRCYIVDKKKWYCFLRDGVK